MATIKAAQLAAQMQAVLKVCPPYECPGTTDYRSIMSGAGCDCSGVPYGILTHYGISFYHGSNTIARKYLTEREKLTSTSQLRVGMAVFKWSASGGEPDKYKPDGLGDFHHIGIVTGTNPLRIVHQSSAAGCTAVDSTIKKWQYCGLVKGIDYADQDESTPVTPVVNGGKVMYKVKVTASSLRIRSMPSTAGDILGSLPMGTEVYCSGIVNGWYVMANADGYIAANYVKVVEEIPVDENDEKNDQNDEQNDQQADPSSSNEDIEWTQRRLETVELAVAELTRRVQALQGGVDYAE